MSRFYARREPGTRDTLGALAVAIALGGLSFYLVRLLLARENLESEPPPLVASGTGRRQVIGSEGAES